MKYKHIFFDLDRTLWDFETNSNKTLLQLINRFSLVRKELIPQKILLEGIKFIMRDYGIYTE